MARNGRPRSVRPWRNERAGLEEGDLAEGVEIRVIGEPAADVSKRLVKAERLFLGKREYVLYPRARLRPWKPCSRCWRRRDWRRALRSSRWGYAALNAAHIFAVALLIGSVVPLNLRLLGVWRGISREAVVRVLAPVAACGLILALITGPLLFSVRAQEYSDVGFLQLKLIFIAVGVLSTLRLVLVPTGSC